MMRRIVSVALLFVLLPAAAFALEMAEGVITSGIQERQPIDQLSQVAASSGTVYCFTRVTGADGETSITHVWLKGDQEMARVELPVRSGNWRTWSSKRLISDRSGDWRVVVMDAQGSELASLPFVVE